MSAWNRRARDASGDLARAEAEIARTRSVSSYIRNLFVTQMGFMAYLMILLGSTSDVDFLVGLRVPIPLLHVELPVAGVYFVAPTILLLLHVHSLLQISMLATLLGRTEASISLVHRGARDSLRVSADPFVLSQAALARGLPGSIQVILKGIALVTVFLLPILVLLAFQLRYLPAHDSSITNWHRLLIAACTIVSFYCVLQLRKFGKQSFGIGFIFSHAVVLIAALIVAFFIAVIPGERNELKIFRPAILALFGPDVGGMSAHYDYKQDIPAPRSGLRDTSTSFLHRNLRLAGATLVRQAPKDEIVALFVERELPLDDVWRFHSQGLDLSGRDLRFANLRGVRMPKVNLRGANLSGANLTRAFMVDAELTGATLVGANLSGAVLNSAQMQESNLVGANLYQAVLTGANLLGSDLSVANIIETDMIGAVLATSNLSGSVIINSTMYGATLFGAKLQHSFVSRSIFTAANLEQAHLGAAVFSTEDPDDLNRIYLANLKSLSFDKADSSVLIGVEAEIDSELGAAVGDFDPAARPLKRLQEARLRNRTTMTAVDHDFDFQANDETFEHAAEADVTFFEGIRSGLKDATVVARETEERLVKSMCDSSDEISGFELRVRFDPSLNFERFEKKFRSVCGESKHRDQARLSQPLRAE